MLSLERGERRLKFRGGGVGLLRFGVYFFVVEGAIWTNQLGKQLLGVFDKLGTPRIVLRKIANKWWIRVKILIPSTSCCRMATIQ
jgi:hypothetical protein